MFVQMTLTLKFTPATDRIHKSRTIVGVSERVRGIGILSRPDDSARGLPDSRARLPKVPSKLLLRDPLLLGPHVVQPLVLVRRNIGPRCCDADGHRASAKRLVL